MLHSFVSLYPQQSAVIQSHADLIFTVLLFNADSAGNPLEHFSAEEAGQSEIFCTVRYVEYNCTFNLTGLSMSVALNISLIECLLPLLSQVSKHSTSCCCWPTSLPAVSMPSLCTKL